jgi:hypothetical protein
MDGQRAKLLPMLNPKNRTEMEEILNKYTRTIKADIRIKYRFLKVDPDRMRLTTRGELVKNGKPVTSS